MSVDAVADELYGLLPEEFIPTRNAREKEAKASGDRERAAQIHALVRPNQVAWVANQLSRHHTDEIRTLIALGADLRAAADSLTAEQLRDFSRQQRQQVGALVQQAKQLAHNHGKKVSDDTAQGLQDTLSAALADPDAADRLLAGCLVEGMQHVGFGTGFVAPARHLKAVPDRPADTRASKPSKPSKPKDKREREVERADQELKRAEAVAQDAVEIRDDTEAEVEKTEQELAELEKRLTKLRAKLEKAESDHSRATRDQRRLRTAFDRAQKVADDAVRRLQRAQAARQQLADEH